MALQDYALRRRTARLFRAGLARKGQAHADELDWTFGRGRSHLQERRGGRVRHLHDPPGHALGRDLYGAGP